MKLTEATKEMKDELLDAIVNGSEEAEARALRAMQRLKLTIEAHRYEVYQQKDGRWTTYVPDKLAKGGRRKVVKKDKEKLIEYLEDYYSNNLKEKSFPTLEEVYPKWQKYKAIMSESNSIKRWDCDWRKFYANEPLSSTIIRTPMNELTRKQIREWAMKIQKKYNLTSKAFSGVMTLFIGCYDMLIDDDRIQYNPARSLKLKKFKRVQEKREIFTKEEVRELIAKCVSKARETGDEVWLAIPMMYYTGLRIGEIEGLFFSDFHDADDKITVQRSLKAEDKLNDDGTFQTRTFQLVDALKQNADPRDVYVPEEVFLLRDEVRRMLDAKGKKKQKVLFQVKTHGNIGAKIKRVCRNTDILSSLSSHNLRKTYGSNVARETGDMDFLRHQLGHKDVATTLKYYVKSTQDGEAKILALQNAL